MLKQYMLKKNKEFNYVYRHSSTVSSDYLVLLYVKNRMGPKIGFSVSKKLGNAVTRNRIKRIFREAVRKCFPLLEPKYSYVFLARAKAAKADSNVIHAEMLKLLSKADLLRKESGYEKSSAEADPLLPN